MGLPLLRLELVNLSLLKSPVVRDTTNTSDMLLLIFVS